jgi:hypothetical protein
MAFVINRENVFDLDEVNVYRVILKYVWKKSGNW